MDHPLFTLRGEAGLTLAALGEKAKVHPAQIAKIEAARQQPGAAVAYRLARALEVPFHRLVPGQTPARGQVSKDATPADALRRCREAAGLSQTDAAEAAGLRQNAISRYEAGQVPSAEALCRLAKAYKVSVDALAKRMFD